MRPLLVLWEKDTGLISDLPVTVLKIQLEKVGVGLAVVMSIFKGFCKHEVCP